MELTTSIVSDSWLSSTAADESLLENVTDSYLLIVEEEEEEEEEFDTARASELIFSYVAPVLIFVGVSGNMLSLSVLQSKYFRRAPSSFVLSALALVDSAVLLTGLFRHWIRGITSGRLDIRWINLFTCKTHYFFTYFTRQLSSWTLVLMTVERLMSVVIPLKAREICNRRRMMAAWFVIFASLFALNSHAFRTLMIWRVPEVEGNTTTIINVCFYTVEDWHFAYDIWPWIDLVVVCVVPVIIIFSSNIVIIYKVVRATRNRTEQMSAKGGDDTTQSLTAMLIAISLVFLLTTTPVSIYFVGLPLWPTETARDQHNRAVAYAALNLIFYFNNCLNFFLYCISGSRFRRTLVAILCCRELKPKTSSAQSGSQYTMTTKAGNGGVTMARPGSRPVYREHVNRSDSW